MIGQLTNHLWQSTLFALAAAILTLVFRRNRANVRYSLWLIASLKFLVPFSVLIAIGGELRWTPVAQQLKASGHSPDLLLTIEQVSQPFISDAAAAPRPSKPRGNWILPTAAAIWLLGFSIIIWLRGRAWRAIRTAVRRSVLLDIDLPVQTRLSPGVLEPGIVGFRRPILLLPEGIIERLAPSEFETVVAHELCHVRRHDNLSAWLHMVVEALFWFHPLVWWIGARLIDERERACDEHVIRLGNRPDVYAAAILNVCKLYTESSLPCVSGVTSADIRRRIEAIMSSRGRAGLSLAKKALLACAALAAIIGPISTGMLIRMRDAPPVLAQPPAQQATQQPSAAPQPQEKPSAAPERAVPPQPAPRFDSASIKPCVTGEIALGRGGSRQVGPPPANGLDGYFSATPSTFAFSSSTPPPPALGRFNVSCGSVMTLIDFAYVELGDDPLLNNPRSPLKAAEHMKGVPDWAMSARYTIEAVTGDPFANGRTRPNISSQGGRTPAVALMWGPMLRALLEDRFRLKIHREQEEVPMYALTVANGGLKVKPATDDECTSLERTPVRPLSPGDKPYCGWMGGDPHGPNRTVLGGDVPLSRLAEFLSVFVMGRHVIDKTGVTEKFNIHLEFAPDETTPCPAPDAWAQWGFPGTMCQVNPNSDIPPAPSVVRAIEQQLGLSLESIAAPRDYLMIDHIERPSEN